MLSSFGHILKNQSIQVNTDEVVRTLRDLQQLSF